MTWRDERVARAGPDDLDALIGLQSELHRSSRTLLEYALDVGWVYVSIADGTPVGYVVFSAAPTRDGAHVAELGIDPAHRREGRARGLIQAVIATADGPVTVFTRPENEAARSVYATLGFAEIGRRCSFYGESGDAIVLRQ